MAKVEQNTEGVDVEKLLLQLPLFLRAKALGQAARAAAAPVRNRARKLVPRGNPNHHPDKKALRDTIKTKIKYYGGDTRATAITGPERPEGNHGHLIELGHDVIVSRGSRAGQKPLSGTARVEGKDFMAPAAMQTRVEQDTAMINKLQQLIKKAEAESG